MRDLNKKRMIRARGLFVVRESDENDREMFNAMREQTYQNHRDIPAVAAILAAGMAPLSGEASFTVTITDELGRERTMTVPIEQIRRGRTKAILFYFEGYWHLWSQTSAHKANRDGVNEFTAILVDTIRRFRPHTLLAANFSRLVRSQAQGAMLVAALAGNVDELIAARMPIRLTGEHAQIGLMMVSMFATVASLERDWIVTRLLTGRIAKWRREEWPHGDGTIPFGYELRDGQLVPDETKREAVREMLIILTRRLPPTEAVRQLDRLGVTSMRKSRKWNRRVGIAAVANATSSISTIYGWAPLWVSGEYLFRMNNVFPELAELSGVSVQRSDDDDFGELQMLYKPGVPDGGWAEPAVLTAFARIAMETARHLPEGGRAPRPLSPAATRASANPILLESIQTHARRFGFGTGRGRGQSTVTAFLGRRWRSVGIEYVLRGRGHGRVEVVRMPDPATFSGESLPDGEEVNR